MKRAAIYMRVSKGDQSIAMQRAPLLELVKARGWKLAATFQDEANTGSHDRRPGLAELLKAAHRGAFDVVAVWKGDRLFRSVRHMATQIPTFAAQGIGFVSVTEPFDTTTPAGSLMLHILAAFAEFERGVLIERTRAGMAEARRRGAQIGRRRRYVDVERAREMLAGGAKLRTVALELGIGYGTLLRALGAQKEGIEDG